MNEAKTNNALTSVNLKGCLDISSIQLLERSFIDDKNKLHFWNNDDSKYSLSGGFLLYPKNEDLPLFPNSYNEDFLWVAYSAIKRNMNTLKLPLDVFHVPSEKKSLNRNRLIYEAFGEILFETLEITNTKAFVEQQALPTKAEIETAIEEYLDYISYVISLIREFGKKRVYNSIYLGELNVAECARVLTEHSRFICDISYIEIQEFLRKWLDQQRKWVEIGRAFPKLIENLISK